jgi:DNA uptake protein ComE-like DNA-binding protein
MSRSHFRLALVAAAAFIAACSSDSANSSDSAAPAADSAAMAAPAAATSSLIDPNTATPEQMAAIPGMDAALADSVAAHRPYDDMRAVDAVLATRLSEEQRDTVYNHMFKPLDLNSATPEEITLIPGIGDRMRHEFEEYRPYKAMEQFRREIGKYVDDAEVARLEKYVRIG